MSIQDHIAASEEFYQKFPTIKGLVEEWIDYSDKVGEVPVEEDLSNLKNYEKQAQEILINYINSLPLDEIKEKRAVVGRLSALTGFIFWQPILGSLVINSLNLLVRRQRSEAGRRSAEARKAKGHNSKYYSELSKKRRKNT